MSPILPGSDMFVDKNNPSSKAKKKTTVKVGRNSGKTKAAKETNLNSLIQSLRSQNDQQQKLIENLTKTIEQLRKDLEISADMHFLAKQAKIKAQECTKAGEEGAAETFNALASMIKEQTAKAVPTNKETTLPPQTPPKTVLSIPENMEIEEEKQKGIKRKASSSPSPKASTSTAAPTPQKGNDEPAKKTTIPPIVLKTPGEWTTVKRKCFAHVINLGVQDILKFLKISADENDIIDDSSDTEDEADEDDFPVLRLRRILKKIERSEQLQNSLRSVCDLLNMKYLAVTVDVSTRWNSTYDMISLGIKLKDALNSLCDHNDKLKENKIKGHEWELLDVIQKYLKPFKSLSTLLCGEKYPTLPLVIVGFNILIDKIEKLIIELDCKEERTHMDEKIILAFKTGRDKMLKHYYKTNWTYCAVLILDPRHKVDMFSRTAWGREMKENSIKKFENIFRANYVTLESQPEKDVLKLFSEFLSGQTLLTQKAT
ncbi:unnamed protein product [Phaedon cochleariae]|uniref:Uncharacterized protein n=1 Tax=Phaedon cochleariae TaxID=80249 RepID=A0A9N9SJL9_PHACE|nr:unnamed protein product [Phaedon cochleariae]